MSSGTHNHISYPTPQMMRPANLNEQGFKEFFGCLRRRKKIIIFFTFLALVCSLIFVFNNKREYQAQIMLSVQPSDNLLSSDRNNPALPIQESVILNTVEMLRSHDVLNAVATDLKLDHHPVFWDGKTKNLDTKALRESVIQRLSDQLTITPVARSLIIKMNYRHTDAVISADIVNHIAQSYQNIQIGQKAEHAKKVNQWLNGRLNELSNNVRKSAQAVETYRLQKDLLGDAKADITTQQLSDISSQLITAQAELAGIQALWKQTENTLQTDKPLDTIGSVTNSKLVTILKRDEALLLSQQADLQSKYGSNHPKMKALQAELAQVRSKKDRELRTVSQNVSNDFLIASAKVESLQNTLNELRSKQKQENEAEIGLFELQREAKANRVLYQNFLNRYKELSIENSVQQSDIKIISAAFIPMSSIGSSSLIIILLALVAGLIFGVTAALILEQLEHHIRTPYQLQMIDAQIPTLAMIPESHCNSDLSNLILDHPHDTTTEAIRTLRVMLSTTANTKQTPQIIATTSTLSGEGKSMTTLWLARMTALSGARVLLIDADTRAPTLSRNLQLNPVHSVADVLLDRKTFDDTVITDVNVPNLSLLAGKQAKQGDIDLFTRDRLQNFINSIKARYDYIFIDTPPIFPVSETKLWLQIASQCLYLVRWDHVPYNLVENIVKQILADGIKIAGFVISRVNLREHAAYRYHDVASHYMTMQRKEKRSFLRKKAS